MFPKIFQMPVAQVYNNPIQNNLLCFSITYLLKFLFQYF